MILRAGMPLRVLRSGRDVAIRHVIPLNARDGKVAGKGPIPIDLSLRPAAREQMGPDTASSELFQ